MSISENEKSLLCVIIKFHDEFLFESYNKIVEKSRYSTKKTAKDQMGNFTIEPNNKWYMDHSHSRFQDRVCGERARKFYKCPLLSQNVMLKVAHSAVIFQ